MNTVLFRKLILVSLLATTAAGYCETSTEDLSSVKSANEMVLTGDVSAVYSNGRFVVWTPKPKATEAAEGVSQGSAAPEGEEAASEAATEEPQKPRKEVNLLDTIDVIAQTNIRPDGSFTLRTEVDEPKQVYFYVVDAVNERGFVLAPIKGQQFILEPGAMSFTMQSASRFIVDGGKYNDAVFNVWKASSAYVVANDELKELSKPVEGESEDERRNRVEALWAKSLEIRDIETEARKVAALTHSDPVVRKLTIQTTWLEGPWLREALHRLKMITPDDPWVADMVAAADESWMENQNNLDDQLVIGSTVRDFEAVSLDGSAVTLSSVQNGSMIVLLDFWASWCGPCRAEFPHMKQAYERFKDRGFEVVSFTIDSAHEDWLLASQSEDLPWLNLGMGPSAEAPTKYDVTGVPRNYLFDAESGEILAIDLRGHRLDERLEEAFD